MHRCLVLTNLILIFLLTGCTPAATDLARPAPHLGLADPLHSAALASQAPTLTPAPASSPIPTLPEGTATAVPSGEAYCLWPGDTLAAIARAAQVDLAALEKLNPDASRYAGSTIHLPPGSLPPDQWILPTPQVKDPENLPSGNSGYYLGKDNRHKRVALTFDIGYVPENLARMVWLHDQGIHATFFLLGISVSRHPDIVGDVLVNGHSLGNHSWDHQNFQGLKPEDINAELQKTEKAVQAADATGTTKPYFRAPFGAVDAQVNDISHQLGYRTIGWTVDSQDWMADATGDQVYARVTQQVCPGAIIAMHDANPANTAALPRIVDFLRANGYEIVPLKDLLGF